MPPLGVASRNLAGRRDAAGQRGGEPLNTSTEYQELFDVYWPVGVGVFVVVAALLGYVVIRYRSGRAGHPGGQDRSRAEEVYALGLVLVAAALVFLTFNTMSDLETPPAGAEPAVEIEVTAAKWNWRFTYLDSGVSEVGTATRDPTLVVPAGTPVRFNITSLDVIHSFFIPMLRFKRDAFPGRVNTVDLVFDEVGFHRGGGECAEYCGLRHAYMDFDVEVMEPTEFDAWIADQEGTR